MMVWLRRGRRNRGDLAGDHRISAARREVLNQQDKFGFAAAPGGIQREQADILVAGGERGCAAWPHAVSHEGLSPKPAVADPFISVMGAVMLLC
jgi:hypothetical protein